MKMLAPMAFIVEAILPNRRSQSILIKIPKHPSQIARDIRDIVDSIAQRDLLSGVLVRFHVGIVTEARKAAASALIQINPYFVLRARGIWPIVRITIFGRIVKVHKFVECLSEPCMSLVLVYMCLAKGSVDIPVD